jgi:hypothetical protein
MRLLRQILAVLLAAHIGFAQAGMAHVSGNAVADASVVSQTDATDAMPCHHHTAPDQPLSTDDSKHKGGCCSAGNCHCAAVCGLLSASIHVTFSPAIRAPRFVLHSAPASASAPDLRPPIS